MTDEPEVDVVAGMQARLLRLGRAAIRFWWGVGVAVAVQLALTVGILVIVLGVTTDTNDDQERLIAPLQGQVASLQETNALLVERNEELSADVEARDAALDEAVAYIGLLAIETASHGGSPGILNLNGVQGDGIDVPPGEPAPEP